MTTLLRRSCQGTHAAQVPHRFNQKCYKSLRIFKRQFTEPARPYSYPLGPSPSSILKPEDPGYSQLLKNLEFFKLHGNHLYTQRDKRDLIFFLK